MDDRAAKVDYFSKVLVGDIMVNRRSHLDKQRSWELCEPIYLRETRHEIGRISPILSHKTLLPRRSSTHAFALSGFAPPVTFRT